MIKLSFMYKNECSLGKILYLLQEEDKTLRS